MRGSRRGLVATMATAVFAVGGVTAIGVTIVSQRHPPQPSESSSDAIPKVGKSLPPSNPIAIDIPSIGVHSVVQRLGLNADGTLEVPAPGPRYDEPAWYRYSPTPGALGPSIISGHVDSAKKGPSVFFDLGDLEPGDDVLVTREDGIVANFEVEKVRTYPKDDFPTQLVYGNTDNAALRLITCGGPFDRSSGHYDDNVIVFGSLVGSHPRSNGQGRTEMEDLGPM